MRIVMGLLQCFSDQSEESTSRERPVVPHVLPELLHRAGRPDDFHLPVHTRYYIHLRRAFATRAAGADHPQYPPYALLPVVHSLLHLSQLHLRQDGLGAEHPAEHRDLLRTDTVLAGHDPRHVGTR